MNYLRPKDLAKLLNRSEGRISKAARSGGRCAGLYIFRKKIGKLYHYIAVGEDEIFQLIKHDLHRYAKRVFYAPEGGAYFMLTEGLRDGLARGTIRELLDIISREGRT